MGVLLEVTLLQVLHMQGTFPTLSSYFHETRELACSLGKQTESCHLNLSFRQLVILFPCSSTITTKWKAVGASEGLQKLLSSLIPCLNIKISRHRDF